MAMEDLSRLLLEERAHSEQFKTNFAQLKSEFDKLLTENHSLKDELLRCKEQKPLDPDEVLELKLKEAEKQLQGKDYLVVSLKEKVHTLEKVTKDHVKREHQYAVRCASTEVALEQTKSMLCKLQLETSALLNSIEEIKVKEEQRYQKDLLELASKCEKSDQERKFIAQKVIKATSKAKQRVDALKQENSLLTVAITKLKETLEQVNSEKSELSSQLEQLKVQQGQERGELFTQIRNLECEVARSQAKCDALDNKFQEVSKEKEKNLLAFNAAQAELIILKSHAEEVEFKYEKEVSQHKKDLSEKDTRHSTEVVELRKQIHELKLEIDSERSKIETQAEKLRVHEKELLAAQEQMRKKEVEVGCKVQDVRIKMENKYRAIIEEKSQSEIEIAKKNAELESQIILERNLRANHDEEFRKLKSENHLLIERIKSLEESASELKRLEMLVQMSDQEKKLFNDEHDRFKQSFTERCEALTKELESVRHQLISSEDKLSELKTEKRELVYQASLAEKETQIRIDQLENDLKASKQKSQQYAKLIWKLRQRLASLPDKDKLRKGLLKTVIPDMEFSDI